MVLTLAACTKPVSTMEPAPEKQGTPSVPVTKPSEKEKVMPKEALYVCHYTTNQVAVIDLATGETVKEIPVGAKPIALIKSPDEKYVYVANSGSGDVYKISTASGEIEAKIAIGNQPVAMTLNATGDILYVLDYYLNRVSIVNLNLRSMVGFYPLNTFGFEERIEPLDCCSDIFGEPMGAGRKPSALALDEARGKIYVGNMGTWDIAVIDIREEKEVETFNATFGINEMIFVGSDNNRLVVSAAGNEIDINNFILSMDLKGGGNIDKLQVGEKPVSIASSPDGSVIYVVTENDRKLWGLKSENGKIIGSCELKGQPGDVVLSRDGGKAYIADLLGGTIFVVDTGDYTIWDNIQAGVTPKALVYVNN
ncbi:YncE family protein [Desulfitobacterium hafniense]|uniref:YncE family protein n=1 Tax=Desulfitobacterium hafniense TaxID=49338 RepID=UPI001FA75E1A|nr:YncE family protein [Desulfitobacterium hafniense]